MDVKQEMYDKIFEEPTTVLGLTNKLHYLKYLSNNLRYEVSLLDVIQNEIKDSTYKLRNISNR